MKLFSLIAIAVLATAVVGCGAARSASVAEESSPQATVEAGAEAPLPEPTATAATTAEPVSLEGAFTYTEMPSYLNAIAPMVAQFFEEQYAGVPDPNLVYVPSGRYAPGACGYSGSWAYAYCPADQTIIVGQDLLWAFYREAGDAAPAIALAHEWGHHIQVYHDVPHGRTAAESVDFENQADCISGAWARYADEQGWLETEDDLADIETLMRLIGSAESSQRDHGTTAERTEAFQSAFESGASACNAYFPDDPVA